MRWQAFEPGREGVKVTRVAADGNGDWVKLSQALENLDESYSSGSDHIIRQKKLRNIIQIEGGEYFESLVINKEVKIVGAENEVVTINGDIVVNCRASISNCIFNGNVTINLNDIRLSDEQVSEIKHNTFNGNLTLNIDEAFSKIILHNNRFVNSTVNLENSQPTKTDYFLSSLDVANNIFKNSKLIVSVQSGYASHEILVNNNIFSNCETAIHIDCISGSTSPQIFDNIFYNNVNEIKNSCSNENIAYNNYWKTSNENVGTYPGTGNSFVDPEFVDPVLWDFRTDKVLLSRGGRDGNAIGLLTAAFPISLSHLQNNNAFVSESINIDSKSRFREDIVQVPISKNKRNNAIAVVLGMSDAEHAVEDANLMERYFARVFGIKPYNIYNFSQSQLTRNEFVTLFSHEIRKAVTPETEVFVYYSGHGVTDETGHTYILPSDGSALPALVPKLCYSLADLYDALNRLNARHTTVILDACFSGMDKNSQPLIAELKGISRPQPQFAHQRFSNLTVISASAGDETSWAMNEMQFGLFTYYFAAALKGFADTGPANNTITLREIKEYVVQKVEEQSGIYGRKQTPNFSVSDGNLDRVLVEY